MNGAAVGVFLVGTFAVLSVPGPSVLFAMARTLEAGRSAGMVSVLGLEVGLTVHVLAATTGLGAVLAASPVALATLRHMGAGYLVLLAVRQLLPSAAVVPTAPGPDPSATQDARAAWGRIFRSACLMDLLNPGTALFLIAFLPKFVDTRTGSPGVQLLQLGILVVVAAVVCDTAWVLVTAHVAVRAARLRLLAGGGTTAGRRVLGLVYLGLAVLVLAG